MSAVEFERNADFSCTAASVTIEVRQMQERHVTRGHIDPLAMGITNHDTRQEMR